MSKENGSPIGGFEGFRFEVYPMIDGLVVDALIDPDFRYDYIRSILGVGFSIHRIGVVSYFY